MFPPFQHARHVSFADCPPAVPRLTARGPPDFRAFAPGTAGSWRGGDDRERPSPRPHCVCIEPHCQQSDGVWPNLGVATEATYVPSTRAKPPVSAHSSKTTLILRSATTYRRAFLRRNGALCAPKSSHARSEPVETTVGFPAAIARHDPLHDIPRAHSPHARVSAGLHARNTTTAFALTASCFPLGKLRLDHDASTVALPAESMSWNHQPPLPETGEPANDRRSVTRHKQS